MWCEAAGTILFNARGCQMQGLGWAAMGQVSAQNGSVAGMLFGAWARVSPGAAAVGSRVSRDAALLPGSASRHRARSGGTRAQGSLMSFAHNLDRKFFLASGRGTMQSCNVQAHASQRGPPRPCLFWRFLVQGWALAWALASLCLANELDLNAKRMPVALHVINDTNYVTHQK